MLCLRRKPGETIVVGDDVEVTVVSLDGGTVRVAISAPRTLRVMRKELIEPCSGPLSPKHAQAAASAVQSWGASST